MLLEFRPDGVSLERVFFAQNVQSALKLGQARGVALLAAAEHGVDVHEYSAVEIKSAVVGFGHATKQQVQMMIGSLLRVSRTGCRWMPRTRWRRRSVISTVKRLQAGWPMLAKSRRRCAARKSAR